MTPSTLRIAYAANRKIGEECLQDLLDADMKPVVLLVPGGKDTANADELKAMLPDVPCLQGKAFRDQGGIDQLASLDLDYVISVHYPYLIPPAVLELPKHGTLNLHPALLPYNRGWHTPTWAIAEGTPFGATLHWVDEGLDTGDIALQKEIEIHEHETADDLYQRALAAERELFQEAIPMLKAGNLPRTPQPEEGTSHTKEEIKHLQQVDIDNIAEDDLHRTVRALTTNRWDEAAYVEHEGEKYYIRMKPQSETEESDEA